jgi:hypothetical protein
MDEWNGMMWAHFAQNMGQWLAPVETAKCARVPLRGVGGNDTAWYVDRYLDCCTSVVRYITGVQSVECEEAGETEVL